MKTCLIIALAVLTLNMGSIKAEIYYVKSNGNDNSNGLSWQSAFSSIQKALDLSVENDEIYVAEGLYHPTFDYKLNIGNRGKHFRLKPGVAIFGGFPNFGNPVWEDRKPLIFRTVICGDLNNDDVWNEQNQNWEHRDDNCYHLFYHPDSLNFNEKTILDGFTIQNGNANDVDSIHLRGGAIENNKNNFIINNCTFLNNYAQSGGAIFNFESNLTIKNSFFIKNIAYSSGGGIFSFMSSLYLSNCVVAENNALTSMGGGIYSYFTLTKYSEMKIINCTITNNLAKTAGGILIGSQTQMLLDGSPGNCNIYNSILYGNKSLGSSEYGYDNDLLCSYVGVWESKNHGKTTLDYCLIGTGLSSQGNPSNPNSLVKKFVIDYFEPKFVGSGENPYMLSKNSRCIDRGFNDYVDEQFDIRGKKYLRKLNGKDSTLENIVDIGAYEFNYPEDAVSVNETDINSFFSVYPNPAGNYISLSESDTKLYESYEIYDISGRLLQKSIFDSNRIDISALESGFYYLRLLSPSGVSSAGFLKMK